MAGAFGYDKEAVGAGKRDQIPGTLRADRCDFGKLAVGRTEVAFCGNEAREVRIAMYPFAKLRQGKARTGLPAAG